MRNVDYFAHGMDAFLNLFRVFNLSHANKCPTGDLRTGRTNNDIHFFRELIC